MLPYLTTVHLPLQLVIADCTVYDVHVYSIPPPTQQNLQNSSNTVQGCISVPFSMDPNPTFHFMDPDPIDLDPTVK